MHQDLNYGEVIDFADASNRHRLNVKRLEVDLEQYQTYLDENDLSDDQKSDFVNALWTVIVAFVDLGYGVHPAQTAPADVIDLPTVRQSLPTPQKATGGMANV